MSRSRYVMKCRSCGAPVADSLRVCPYCSQPIHADALGEGVRSTAPGQAHIHGASVVVGVDATELRECPFCGASRVMSAKHCAHCGAKLIIETLYLRSLTITKGGSLTVTSGGKVTIGRPGPAPLLAEAAARGDLDAVKARITAGDELDASDAQKKTPLLHALEHGHLVVAQYLVAMGANVADADEQKTTPLHLVAARGFDAFAEVLLALGADGRARTRAGRTPRELALENGHDALAQRLA